MRKIGLLIFFAVFACSLSAQNRLSVFIGNANRYASLRGIRYFGGIAQ